jgi:hypothetical protein
MLRRTSIAIASAAILGMCAAPAFASPAAKHANSGKFTVPAASSAVKGWGNYHIINAHRVHVQVCAKRSGGQFVGVEAVAYNGNYSRHSAIASVIGPETPGGGSGVCAQMNLIYTGHLKVFSFLGVGGSITKKTSMKSIY